MAASPRIDSGPAWRRDVGLVVLLLLLAGGIRAWVVRNTEVPARDSIGFIRYALQLEKEGWARTVTSQHQHPGYSLTIVAVARPLRSLLGDTAETMELAAQLASALAGLLLVVPMYFLGRHLFDRGAGFWGALLFQCLPSSGRLLSDAISDSLFLLLLATALLFALQGIRARSPWRFALAGVSTGLAYLTRPEGLLLVAAAGLTLVLCQLVPAWRQPWRQALACAVALVLAVLAVGAPYYLTVGAVTNKPAAGLLAGKAPEKLTPAAGQPAPLPQAPPPASTAPAPFTPAMVGNFADIEKWQKLPLSQRTQTASWILGTEFVQCYLYVGWLPVLLGLWWCRSRFRQPDAWLLVLLFALDALVLWLLAVRAGYLSARHVLVLVLCTVFQAAAVLRDVPLWLGETLARHSHGRRPAWLNPAAWSLTLLLLLTGTGLSRTLHALHGNRAGHRAAGRWLASHTQPSDRIDDDHCWASYYANRVLLEYRTAPPAPAGYQPRHFVVINRSNPKKTGSYTPLVTEAQVKQEGGQVVYSWPETGPVRQARVVVFELPASR
jgi:hypothetical protein